MMTQFFESSFRILQLRGGQDGRLLDVFIQELVQSGFAEITARRHIRAAEHLLYWAKRKGISPATFDEHTLDEFTHHLGRCCCKSYGSTHRQDLQKGARLFVCSLRRAELLPMPSALPLLPANPARVVTKYGSSRVRTAGVVMTLPSSLLRMQRNRSPCITEVVLPMVSQGVATPE